MPWTTLIVRRWKLLAVVALVILAAGAVIGWRIIGGRRSAQYAQQGQPLPPVGDLIRRWNEEHGRGVTAENNAVVPLVRAIGLHWDLEGRRDEAFRLLGMTPPDPRQPTITSQRAFLDGEAGKSALAAARLAEATQAGPATHDHFEDISPSNLFFDEQLRCTRGPWQAETAPLIAAWIKANEVPLTLVAEASRRPRYFAPGIATTEHFQVHSARQACQDSMLDAVHLLVARAMQKAAAGDDAGAWADLLVVYKLAALMQSQETSLVGWVVGALLEAQTSAALREWIRSRSLPPALLATIQADFGALAPQAEYASCIDLGCAGEQEFIADGSRYGFAEAAGEHGPLITVEGATDWEAVARRVNAEWERRASAFRMPTFRARRAALVALEDEAKAIQRREGFALTPEQLAKLDENDLPLRRPLRGTDQVADYFATWGAYPLAFADAQDCKAKTSRNLDRLAVALAAHKAGTGRYPDRLDALVPYYVPTVPPDIFSDAPLSYSRTADGYILYSVGPNLKDDGGVSDLDGKDDLAVRVLGPIAPVRPPRSPASAPN